MERVTVVKLRCNKSDLVNGINIVSKAIPSKTTMSILQCILVDSTKGCIKLTANDTELGIETIIEGEIVEKGIVALDAKIFLDIVRKLPDNVVTIQTDSTYITNITCEKARFNIIGKSGDEYTYLPEIEKADFISISQLTLREIINRTIFSVAEDNNNKIMTGELFEIKGDNLRVAALDGHRISLRNVKLKESYSDRKVIIPGKTLSDIAKIITGGYEDYVNIFFTDKNVLFEFDTTVVVSRLIEGEYFNVDQMLSNNYNTKVIIDKKELISSIDRATLLVKEGDKKPVIVNITDDQIELKINSTIGSMNESIDITKEGNDIMIGFNPKFLMDALRVIEDEKISIHLLNTKAPCFIKDDEGKYVYIVLPVNFNTVV